MFAGGFFGLGLIRDLWRIPEYVKDVNEDSSYMEQLIEKMRKYPKPPVGTLRYFGQMMVSDAFGYLVIRAIPQQLLPEMLIPAISSALVPIAAASATRGLLETDHVILNDGQVTGTTPELASPSPNYHTTPT
ncbi:dnaJ subfamily C member 22 [Trichonephila clavipes]|nr:dnaJ subfamily C member 22 [Trichonephila clavipes]